MGGPELNRGGASIRFAGPNAKSRHRPRQTDDRAAQCELLAHLVTLLSAPGSCLHQVGAANMGTMETQPQSKFVYRLAAGAITAALVAAQYGFTVVEAADGALLGRSLKFFSFFTILTNLLAAAALLTPAIAPRSAMGRFLDRPGVRTAIAGYMIMVGAVYYLLLAGLSHRQGAALLIEHALHAVTPPLFLLDWLLFVDRRALDWRIGLRGLTYPLIYLGWILGYGAASGWYPYPFIDVADLGYTRVLANATALVAVYIALEVTLVAIGRAIPARAAAE